MIYLVFIILKIKNLLLHVLFFVPTKVLDVTDSFYSKCIGIMPETTKEPPLV